MKNIKYEWQNFGLIRRGYDLANLTIILENRMRNGIKLIIDAGSIKIEDETYNKLEIKKAFEKLEQIKLPEQLDYTTKGCDGNAWKLEIDGIKYSGYLQKPDFLKSILDIIEFDNIFKYAKEKIKNYNN